MSPTCLAVLLSLATACTLPGSPVTLRVSPPPRADLCVQYEQRTPLCVSGLVNWRA
ncbi:MULTISPECIES: hypothetical protein [Stenotrophomonas]|uniref:hypothetical protein n=1 Tax=Stenotrophomonas TaxID=40323 RepID=UPI00159F653B|nr:MULTISPECIES: hypothetical protein [Stenotrophomonas]